MKPHRLIANRLIKLLGHTTKLLCYPFHAVFPNKRFTIKRHAKPLFTSKSESRIARTVWLTNYTDRVALPVYLNYLFNRLLSPSHEFRFMSDEQIQTYIHENFDAPIAQAYMKLNDGAAKADLWRLLVLNHLGGVYMDIDAHLVWPLGRIIGNSNREFYITIRNGHYTNYFFASSPNNPYLSKAIEMILDNINANTGDKGVYALTGPDVLNKAIDGATVPYEIYRYVSVQGSFTNEHFQYIDKKHGKWIHAKAEDLIKKD